MSFTAAACCRSGAKVVIFREKITTFFLFILRRQQRTTLSRSKLSFSGLKVVLCFFALQAADGDLRHWLRFAQCIDNELHLRRGEAPRVVVVAGGGKAVG